jgi:hypothetical protein
VPGGAPAKKKSKGFVHWLKKRLFAAPAAVPTPAAAVTADAPPAPSSLPSQAPAFAPEEEEEAIQSSPPAAAAAAPSAVPLKAWLPQRLHAAGVVDCAGDYRARAGLATALRRVRKALRKVKPPPTAPRWVRLGRVGRGQTSEAARSLAELKWRLRQTLPVGAAPAEHISCRDPGAVDKSPVAPQADAHKSQADAERESQAAAARESLEESAHPSVWQQPPPVPARRPSDAAGPASTRRRASSNDGSSGGSGSGAPEDEGHATLGEAAALVGGRGRRIKIVKLPAGEALGGERLGPSDDEDAESPRKYAYV